MAKKDNRHAELVSASVNIEAPYELPEGWKWEKWGNVGKFISGNGFKEKFQGFTNYNIPFYKVGSLKFSDSTGFLFDRTNTINDEILKELKATLIPENSIIFAKIGEAIRLNRRSINSEKCCIDNNLMAFLPENCDYKYAFFWSKSIDLYNYTNATTVPAIRKSDLEEIPFPLPPTLAEQQRIVNRIETMVAKLDQAQEKAQAVLDSFETRKAAILHKAFTSQLKIDTEELTIEDWEEKSFSELGTTNLGKMLDANKNTGDDVQYLRNINVRWFDFDLSDLMTMKAKPEEIKKLSVKKGDLFICEGGEPGRCAVWKDVDTDMIFQKAIHRFRPNEETSSEFVAYELYYLNQIGKLSDYFTGTTIKHLTGQSLAKLPIKLPPLNYQLSIVNFLDSVLEKESRAKEAAQSVLDKIALLKKSILVRAFRGEL